MTFLKTRLSKYPYPSHRHNRFASQLAPCVFFLDLGSDFCHNSGTSLAGAPSGGILTKRSEVRSPRPAGMPDPGDREPTRRSTTASRQELADRHDIAPESVARDRKEPQQSAERRASRIARGSGTPRRGRAGVVRCPPREPRKPPRFSALRSPHLGERGEKGAKPRAHWRRGINQARP